MTNLITEARELCEKATPGPWFNFGDWMIHTEPDVEHNGIAHEKTIGTVRAKNAVFIARSRTLIPELCDALEKAAKKNEELMRELSQLARESVERDKALARLEAEVGVALGKGCDYCGLIYAIHAESYGIEDLDCENEPIDNKFCPMCGKKLPVYAGTIGGEIVQHAMKEMEK